MPLRDRSVRASFDKFAEQFVHVYWETVKSGAFPMPPNYPVEESFEELLSEIAHRTEVRPTESNGRVYALRMTSKHGGWWEFAFRNQHRTWELLGATAPSASDTPHDLLGPVYAADFAQFLQHITRVANQATAR